MKEQLTSQVFSLLSLILIPFIPNSTLRYIAVVLASISLVAYLVYHNTPTRQVDRLDAAAKEVNTLFETGLKLTEYDPHIGTGALADYIQAELRGVDPAFTTLSMRPMSWKGYAYRLRAITSSIEEWRRELEELRSSILLALECARQQRKEQSPASSSAVHEQAPDERPAVFERMSFRTG
ncbi:hypothetical protein B0H14DRAFT_3890084 [Mycena olivaceomarginata]|nr:hypothetical protein B0H14DRAFT_3890084 [Mycena olivaceomarginata]